MPQIENSFSVMSEKSKEDVQGEVAAFWNAEPCDSENSRLSPATRQYYSDIEQDRYVYQGHILETLEWLDWKGKDILEIGTGVGTDARQLISRGAKYNGVNVDAGSCEATRTALGVFGISGNVKQMSAIKMDFDNKSFDIVYSFGVLHHIPDVRKAVTEIQRVLKPGGHLLFMVYNRSSINYRIEIRHLRKWLLRILMVPGLIPFFRKIGFPEEKLKRHVELFKTFGKMSDAEWLSRNTDGPDNPYSLVYGEDEIAPLLGNEFQILKNEVYFFDWRHWGPLGRVLPITLIRWLGRHWGWHRVVLAQKQ